jgi:APA family basic amino acid/polyamine antiporter
MQTAMAALKFLMLASVTVWALSQAPSELVSTPGEYWNAVAFGPGWGLAIMFSMFAYLGWSAAIYSAAETHEPRITVPRAMLLGTGIVLLLYLGVNVALLKHIALGEIAKEKAVLELLVRKLFGGGASRAFAGLVSFALLSSMGASAFLGPRVLHTMLLWSRPACTESSERELPEVSWKLIWIQALLSMAMILSGTFEQILTVTGFLLGIFPILAVLTLYTARANRDVRVPFRARCFAIPVFIAGSLLILVLGAIERPLEMAVASGVVFLIVLIKHQLARSRKLSA